MKKVFISYSHNNTQEKEELKKHLTVLERKGLIDSWDDSEIETGVQWRETILAELKSSNVIIFLVSSDFLASNFINDVEIKEAIELNKQGDIEIFPVILNDCLWKETFLGTVQALPLDENRRLKPISGWDDKNQAYFKVSEAILNSLDNPNQKEPKKVGIIKPDLAGLNPPAPKPVRKKKKGTRNILITLLVIVVFLAAWKIVPDIFDPPVDDVIADPIENPLIMESTITDSTNPETVKLIDTTHKELTTTPIDTTLNPSKESGWEEFVSIRKSRTSSYFHETLKHQPLRIVVKDIDNNDPQKAKIFLRVGMLSNLSFQLEMEIEKDEVKQVKIENQTSVTLPESIRGKTFQIILVRTWKNFGRKWAEFKVIYDPILQ